MSRLESQRQPARQCDTANIFCKNPKFVNLIRIHFQKGVKESYLDIATTTEAAMQPQLATVLQNQTVFVFVMCWRRTQMNRNMYTEKNQTNWLCDEGIPCSLYSVSRLMGLGCRMVYFKTVLTPSFNTNPMKKVIWNSRHILNSWSIRNYSNELRCGDLFWKVSKLRIR